MSEVIIPEYIIYTRYGEVMISSNPIIECCIFKNDTYNEPYILKSKYDELLKIGANERILWQLNNLNNNLRTLQSKYDLLLKEKEELEKENEWISVEDRLPEFDSCVFFYYLVWQIIDGKKIPNKIPLIGWYKRVPSGGGCFLTREDREDWFIKEEGITHWKQLPKAPIIKPTEK